MSALSRASYLRLTTFISKEYRSGNYQRAQDLYSQIFDSLPVSFFMRSMPSREYCLTACQQSDEQSDCLTNLSASQTHLEFLQAGFLRALHVLPASLTNALEDAPPPPLPALHPVLAAVPTSQQAASAPKKRTPRVSRIPKGVVPGVTPPPDPERWLKKNERTNMPRGSGKRRKGVAAGATQGSLTEGGSKGGGGKGKKRK